MIEFFSKLFNNQTFLFISIGILTLMCIALKSPPAPKKDPLEKINESLQDIAKEIKEK